MGKIFQIYPYIQEILKYVCAAYLLYLGYKIIGSFSEHQKDSSRPLKLYEAALFQFVNPKAWVICITAVSLFYPETENLFIGTLFMVIMSTIINIPSISIWAFGGSIIRHYLQNKNLNKILEWILAFMLLATAYSVLMYNA